ncbi:hypothetical protein C8J57DRAFT_1542522 [Mycena rebaudengoi]|nr:hypothetical protein C8J57DRAFT_1542522 [Mycena rebaudengoi]
MEALGAAIKRRKFYATKLVPKSEQKIFGMGGRLKRRLYRCCRASSKAEEDTPPPLLIELYQMKTQYKPKIEAALRRAGYFSIGERPDEDKQDNWVDESDGSAMAHSSLCSRRGCECAPRVVKALFDAEPANERDALKAETEGEKVKMALEKAIPEENTRGAINTGGLLWGGAQGDAGEGGMGRIHDYGRASPTPERPAEYENNLLWHLSGGATTLKRLTRTSLGLRNEAEPAPEEPQSKKSKPRKSKKKSKKAQPSVPTDTLPDIALAAADTLPGVLLQLASLL